MSERVIAIIPARGESKRLPRKNIYPFFGRPLLQWTIEACKKSKYISDIYVSTEDQEIKAIAEKLGAKVIDRPLELAGDDVWTQEVLKHAVRHLVERGEKFDIVARLQANSPQIQAKKIDEAIKKLVNHKRWEIFSVDEEGLEDAAIHILRKEVVFQEAFSVYKGVITTNYTDIHTQEDVRLLEEIRIKEIEQKSHDFLRDMYEQSLQKSWRNLVPRTIASPMLNLWIWQTHIPLYRRWKLLVESSPALQTLLASVDCYERAQKMTVLDLGCGFGMYWPVLREYGFRRFVGIDLFDMRGQQNYLNTARKYVEHFCADCETQVIMDDVRNLDRHQLIADKFDIILNVATVSTKAGSTGIPRQLFQEVVKKYGRAEHLPVHLENAH